MDTTPDVDLQTQAEKAKELYSRFALRRDFYSRRNQLLVVRNDGFEGNHWPLPDPALTEKQKEKAKEKFQLVMNYTRRVVLGYVAALARQPKPRVPAPKDDLEAIRANKREKLLMLIWEDLMTAWYDVELNAAKLGYGVLQVVWNPDPDQPKEVNVGIGENVVMKKRLTKNPYTARSIPPNLFFPIFRTYDHPNDFHEIFRLDPGRLVADLEARYGVKLQGTGTVNGIGWREIETEPTCDVVEWWSKDRYMLIAVTQKKYSDGSKRPKIMVEPGYAILRDIENPYKGKFPFWVVQNIRNDSQEDPTILGSISDIEDILQLNKHLDLVISESAEEVITNIHRPLVYKTDEPSQDPAALVFAAGAVYPIGMEEELDPLDYKNDPAGVEAHMDRIFKAFEDLTFMGSAGFGDMENSASGIAARVALTPMQQVLELKLPQRQRTLRLVCGFLLEHMETKMREGVTTQTTSAEGVISVEQEETPFTGWIQGAYQRFELISVTPADINGAYFCDVTYGNLLPRDEYAYQQNEVYKWKTGTQSLLTTLDGLGVDDANAELERIKKELQDPILNPEKVMAQKQLEMMGQSQPAPAPTPTPAPAPAAGPQQGQPPLPGMGPGNEAQGLQGGVQSLPGPAQPGTQPLSQLPPPGGILGQTAPQIPGAAAQQGGSQGQAVPYMKRRGK